MASTSSTSESTTSESTLSTTSLSSGTSLSTSSSSSYSTSSTSISESTTSLSSGTSQSSTSVSEEIYENELLVRVRKLINDVDSVRFSNDELFLWMTDAIRRIRKIRPETKLDEDGNLTSFSEIVHLSDTIPLTDDWRKSIVDYMCFRAFSEIAVDEASRTRAIQYKESFNESINIT